MSSYFLDSSALVKRYRQEPGSSWMHAICRERMRATLYISGLADIEVPASLSRIATEQRLHDSWLDATILDATINEFLRHAQVQYHVIELSPGMRALARSLVRAYRQPHPLRTLDALQLACGLAASMLAPDLTFVTADTRLASICEREQLRAVNPLMP